MTCAAMAESGPSKSSNSTAVACFEETQKLTPWVDTVAPMGWERPGLVSLAFMIPSILEEQRGNQGRPARLVAGPNARAVVPMEILKKRNAIPPVWVGLKVVVIAPDGASPTAG